MYGDTVHVKTSVLTGLSHSGASPYLVRDIRTRNEENRAPAVARRTSKKSRSSRRARRFGKHAFLPVKVPDRLEHLLLADQHHLVHQFPNRLNIPRIRSARSQSIGASVAAIRG